MKTKECIHCAKMFNCSGKPTKEPCLHYKERTSKYDSIHDTDYTENEKKQSADHNDKR